MTTQRQTVRRAVLAFCLSVLCVLASAPARSTVVGTPHQFTGETIEGPGRGVCTVCHIPHGGLAAPLWPRDLSQEAGIFNQTADPNYRPGRTLLCYDCHANPAETDQSPPDNAFPSDQIPQDVAFDDDMKSTQLPRDSLDNDDKPGFYENIPSMTKPPTSTMISGHYFKQDPGLGVAKQYDKLPCGDCHDPHVSRNQAFIRPDVGGKTGIEQLDNVKASTNMAYEPIGITRDDADSRKFCIACHGTLEQTTYKAVKFSDVNPAYGNSTIAKPTTNVGAHRAADVTACTNCHLHNRPIANCNECHGFPPLDAAVGGNYFDKTLRPYTENYDKGAGAHQRHLDALGTAVFDCSICHGPNPGSATWHNNGSGTFSAANVDIIGKRSWWDPDNTRTTGYVGGNSTETLPPAEVNNYDFLAKGGGNQRCYGLACHGEPPNTADALNWTDNMLQDGGETATFEITICTWCHDGTPATISGVEAPNVMGNGTTWGAEVNGHGKTSGAYDADSVGGGGGLTAANKGCAICHDATYTPGSHASGTYALGGPDKAHFDGSYASSQKRLNDSINGETISSLVPANGALADAACIACHQRTTGSDDGTQISSHGNHFNGSVEAAFQRECRACHEPHGRNWNGLVPSGGTNGRNLHMVGKWLDNSSTGTWGTAEAGEEARVDSNATSNAVSITADDARVVFTVNNGENSYDDGYDDSLHESVCVVCHASLVNAHNQAGDTTLRGSGHNPVGTDCMSCHGHNPDSDATNYDAFAPSGCTACHGATVAGTNAQGEAVYAGQFWPDGTSGLPAYADDEPGAHFRHVETVAAKVFNETPAQLVTDTSVVSATKQILVCGFCHRNPGESGHHLNGTTTPSGVDRVDVLQGGSATNYFSKFTPGTHATYNRTNFGDDTTGLAYNYPNEVCSNLVCHNQATSPASPTGWNAPPTWSVTAKCDNTSCHAASTYATSSGVHAKHVNGSAAGGRGYLCTECHVANTSQQHQNASVDMNGSGSGAWNGAGSLEGTAGIGNGNGYYDKDASGGASPGDARFAYKNGSYGVTCYLIYCHGADNPSTWHGNSTTPAWNNTATTYCGSCHDGNGTGSGAGGTDVVATPNHPTHLNSTLAYGPQFGNTGCVGNASTGCHPSHATTSTSHADGTVNFLNLDGTTVANLADTNACSGCHGASTANAKNQTNWDNASYKLPCIECHDATNPGNSHRDGSTGVDAPPKSAYWTTAGHGSTGTYTPSGRSGANATCASCHNAATAHIDGTIGTTDRLTTVAVGNALCNNCHDGPGPGGSLGNATTRVSTHANGTYTPANAFKDRQRAVFELNCVECHDVHGTSNIYMVNRVNTNGPLVLPRKYNGSDNTTTFLMHDSGSVAFTDHSVGTGASGSGVGFATNAAGDATKICQTCHTQTVHYQYNSADAHFVSVCTACHPHEFDDDNATHDGFMPKGSCEDCHNGSAAANGAPNVMTHWTGSLTTQDGGHGDPNGMAAVECTACHDISVPTSPASAGHDGTGAGTYNSIWYPNATTRSTNTSHLKAEYFTKYKPTGSNDYDVQVAFDEYCNQECHPTNGVNLMRHSSNADYTVKFGKSQTPPKPPNNVPDNLVEIPIDVDLNTTASPTGDYAPCISCHDPHGTGTKVPSGYSSNRMVRYQFPVETDPTMKSELCAKCHR